MTTQQQELFHRARMVKYNVDRLISFVQNDLMELYNDGHLTVQDVDKVRKDLDEYQRKFSTQFSDIVSDIDQYMQDVTDAIESNSTPN